MGRWALVSSNYRLQNFACARKLIYSPICVCVCTCPKIWWLFLDESLKWTGEWMRSVSISVFVSKLMFVNNKRTRCVEKRSACFQRLTTQKSHLNAIIMRASDKDIYYMNLLDVILITNYWTKISYGIQTCDVSIGCYRLGLVKNQKYLLSSHSRRKCFVFDLGCGF